MRILEAVSKRRRARRVQAVEVASAAQGGQVVALRAPIGRDRDELPRAGAIPQERPMPGFLDMDRVGQVKSIIRTFEEGLSLEHAARFADAIMRDDRIQATIDTRIGALLSAPLEVKGATTKLKHRKLADRLQGSDEQRGIFWEMFPRHVLTELLFWGRMVGFGLAEKVWDTSDPTNFKMTTRVWHPQHVRFDWERDVYQVRIKGGAMIDLPNTEKNPRSDSKWILYTPYGFRTPWRRALLRPLAMLYLARQWTMRDWSRYSEKHGLPLDVAHIPENAPPHEKSAVMQAIANRNAESAIFFPTGGPDAPKFSLEVVEASGTAYQGFAMQLSKLEADIAITVLGQNLTTEVKGGSFAAAEVHEAVALLKLFEDAGIAEVLVDQGISHWVEAITGDPADTPTVRFVVEEPEDELKEAQTFETLGSAVQELELAGMRVDKQALAHHYGVPVLEATDDEDDDLAQGRDIELTPSALGAIVTVNEARKARGMGPLTTDSGAPDPDGDLTIAEFIAQNAEVVAAGAKAQAGTDPAARPPTEPGGLEDPGKARPDDRQVPTDLETLRRAYAATGTRRHGATDTGTQARLSEPAGPRVAGHKRTARYAGALEAAAQRRAARALARDLKGINEDIKAATSFDDLKRRVLRRYKGADAATLKRLVERANIMAHMAGRLGALEEL